MILSRLKVEKNRLDAVMRTSYSVDTTTDKLSKVLKNIIQETLILKSLKNKGV